MAVVGRFLCGSPKLRKVEKAFDGSKGCKILRVSTLTSLYVRLRVLPQDTFILE
jgi:hypothetical protein